MHLFLCERRSEPALRGGERRVVGFQERALVVRVDRKPRRERLSGDRIRARAFHPVKVNRPAAAMLGQIVLQPVLHREIRRMRRVGAGHHDGGVDVAEHRLVAGAGVARAFLEHGRIERGGHRLLQHVDDPEIDPAGTHHFVADVRNQIRKDPRVRNRQHPLPGRSASCWTRRRAIAEWSNVRRGCAASVMVTPNSPINPASHFSTMGSGLFPEIANHERRRPPRIAITAYRASERDQELRSVTEPRHRHDDRRASWRRR